MVAQDLFTLEVKTQTTEQGKLIDSIGYKSSHASATECKEAIETLSQRLLRLGYFEHRFSELERRSDTVFFSKLSGLETKASAISIIADKETKEFIPELKLRDTSLVEINAIEEFMGGLLGSLERTGQLFTEVSLKEIHREHGKLFASLAIEKKPGRTIDDIIVKGYERFPRSFLKYASRLKIGKELDRDLIARESESLANLSFIDQIKAPEILFESDSSSVYLYLEKAKSNYFDGFVGFNTEEESGNIKLNGYVDLRLTNNLHAGETLALTWKNDGREQSSFNGQLGIPFIFRSPLGIDANLNIFRKDSTFTNTTLEGKLTYLLSPNSSLNAGVIQLDSNATLDGLIDTQDLNGTFFTAGYHYRKPYLQSVLFRDKTSLEFSGAIGNRRSDTIGNQQIKLSLNANRIFDVTQRSQLFLNSSSGFLNSDDFFDNEKYRIGGINSIRGFNENAIEATLFSYLNLEYRYLLSQNAYVHTISDLAFVRDDLTKAENTLYGLGVGLALQTGAGIFKLNYSIGGTDETSAKFSESKVHISYSSIF